MKWEIETWEDGDGQHWARCEGEGISVTAGPKSSENAASKKALQQAEHEKRKVLES